MNHLVRTELLKLRTTRTFVAGICAAPVVAGLVTIAILGAAGKQGNDPLGPDSLVYVMGGPAAVITLIAVLLGVLGMAGEYRHQTITTTFLASPRRRDVVVAKLVAHSLTGALMGLASLAVSAAIAVPWLHASGVDVHLDGEGVRVAVGLIASTALYGSLGVSIGALVRNQTIAASVVLTGCSPSRGSSATCFVTPLWCSGCPPPPAGLSSTSVLAATASPCPPPPASSPSTSPCSPPPASVSPSTATSPDHPRRNEPRPGAIHEHQPEPADPRHEAPDRRPSPDAAVTLLALTGCPGSVVHNYRTFQSALDRGASCSELYDQRSRYDDEDTLAKMDRDLDRIGCTSPDAERTD